MRQFVIFLFFFCIPVLNDFLFSKEINIVYTYNSKKKLSENNIFEKTYENKKDNDIFINCGNFLNFDKLKKKDIKIEFPFNKFKFDIFTIGENEIDFGIKNLIDFCSKNNDITLLNSNLQYCENNACYLFAKSYKELFFDENEIYITGLLNYKGKEKGLKADENFVEIVNRDTKKNKIKIIIFNNFDYDLVKNNIRTDIEAIYFIIGNNNKKFEKNNKSYILLINKNHFLLGKMILSIKKNKILKVENIFIK